MWEQYDGDSEASGPGPFTYPNEEGNINFLNVIEKKQKQVNCHTFI